MRARRHLGQSLFTPTLAFLLSVLISMGILLFIGESPWVLIDSLAHTLLTDFGLGYAFFYTTPLIFTGLSVAVANHCGLFNIGAEGQLYLGSLGVIISSWLFSWVPWPVSLVLGITFAILFGAAWGSIAGLLKSLRGSHEVIVTILLNFIGISLVNYCILYPLKSVETPNPETFRIAPAFQLTTLHDLFKRFGLDWFNTTPANTALFLALAMAAITHYILFFTPLGFELRAVGENPRSSRFAGISTRRSIFLAMCFSGGLAGLVGVNEVMGYEHRLIEGFSPGYGFTGIAVALLARNHPLGIPLAAFLFGTLHNSARELEFLSEHTSKELSLVLQGILVALVASHHLINKLWKKKSVAPPPKKVEVTRG